MYLYQEYILVSRIYISISIYWYQEYEDWFLSVIVLVYYTVNYIAGILTFKMGKCTKSPPRTVASILNVITLRGFIDFRVKLLLSPGV